MSKLNDNNRVDSTKIEKKHRQAQIDRYNTPGLVAYTVSIHESDKTHFI